ncbi:MAG: sodium/solute symporter [bacterium]|jgi:SSS family solute:Na+ symporter|nr:sodium/solute symporter [bacterium]
MNIQIATADLIIIIVYILAIVGLGCWVGIRKRGKDGEGKAYFLAGGTLTWPIIGLALFSTNISTIHLVSLAQEGYVNGLAYGNFEWMAPFTLIILSLFFAPFYIRSRVSTLPDFLEARYNRACRDWLAVLSIISAIFLHIGFSLYTGAVVLKGMFGLGIHFSIVLTAVLTGLYTIVGGLMAVVVTESIQTIILLLGAICITAIAYFRIGGWAELSAAVDPIQLTVMRAADDPSGLPWYSVLLGYPVIGIWYWCADQTIVQRVLGAKDENHARLGPLFAGFIKILPVFIFVLPGLICLGLVNQGKMDIHKMKNLEVGPALIVDEQTIPINPAQRVGLQGQTVVIGGKALSIEGKEAYAQNNVLYIDGMAKKDTLDTYSFMIRELLPVGLRGLVAAALLAALMGTVSGALNSIATLFTYDLYKRWRPQTNDRALVHIGRIATFVAMIAAILWSPLLGRFESVFQGINSMISYIAPPITVVFLWGVLWKRASSRAAQITLYSGSVLGLIIFVLDWNKDTTGWNVPFMMSAFYLFAIGSVIMVLSSLAFPHTHTEESRRLVWNHPLEAVQGEPWRGLADYRFLAALLAIVMILLYAMFI